ncbi:MAG TPA: hypothetical protein VFV32_13090 [Acidimicrobiales bacterium]|nr:hypothetical protein [Acidimicrobiales bacterium]
MLSAAADTSRWRSRTLRLAWPLSTRALPLATLAAALALAGAPSAVVLVRGGRDLGGALVVATIVLGALAGFPVDDPAEETLSASPTGLARRRLLRLAAIAMGVTIAAAALVAVAAAVGDVTLHQLGLRAAELAATSTLAAAAAGWAQRRAVAAPGATGALVGVLGVLLVSALGARVDRLPSLLDTPQHHRWWMVAAVASAAAAWTWRDPSR